MARSPHMRQPSQELGARIVAALSSAGPLWEPDILHFVARRIDGMAPIDASEVASLLADLAEIGMVRKLGSGRWAALPPSFMQACALQALAAAATYLANAIFSRAASVALEAADDDKAASRSDDALFIPGP